MTERFLLVDASALVELAVGGRHREAADALFDHLLANPDAQLLTAAHGLIETVSAVRRFALTAALSEQDAETALLWLQAIDIALDPAGVRLPAIWQLRHTISAYDAAYAATAQALELPLITADQRLATACARLGIETRSLETALS